MAALALPALSENTSSFVPLPFFRAKVFCFPSTLERRSKALEPAYYTNSLFFRHIIRGKIFLHVEMPWAKLFWTPYLNKNFVLMD